MASKHVFDFIYFTYFIFNILNFSNQSYLPTTSPPFSAVSHTLSLQPLPYSLPPFRTQPIPLLNNFPHPHFFLLLYQINSTRNSGQRIQHRRCKTYFDNPRRFSVGQIQDIHNSQKMSLSCKLGKFSSSKIDTSAR